VSQFHLDKRRGKPRSKCKDCSKDTTNAYRRENRKRTNELERHRRLTAIPKFRLKWWRESLDKARSERELLALFDTTDLSVFGCGAVSLRKKGPNDQSWSDERDKQVRKADKVTDRWLAEHDTQVAADDSVPFWIREDLALIDADGWVMPWWLGVAARPTVGRSDAKKFLS
jgi:hypothetical protein